jgi:LPS export ABC transporter protein LptC
MYRIWFFCIIAAGMIVACAEPDDTNNFVYLGPVMIVEDLNVSYLDSGRVAVKVSTAIQQKMKNEDEVYPKTVYVNFINKDGVEYSSLRGDSGKYFKSENYYLIQGNVFVYNREQQQSLSTNELIWTPSKQKFHTNKKVKVNTPNDQIVGNGMEANQDFSSYKFTGGITGYFQVDSLVTQPEKALAED